MLINQEEVDLAEEMEDLVEVEEDSNLPKFL